MPESLEYPGPRGVCSPGSITRTATSPGNHSPWTPPSHPLAPSPCTAHIPGKSQPMGPPHPLPPPGTPIPLHSHPCATLIPLCSQSLGPHIWRPHPTSPGILPPPSPHFVARFLPPPRTPQPSVPAPLALSVPRSPLPGPPGPRSRPAHPSPGGGGGARCGNRCAPLPPPGSARPRCSPGAVVRLQHPRAPAAAKNPALAPKKPLPGGDAAGSGPPGMPVGDPAAPVLTFS